MGAALGAGGDGNDGGAVGAAEDVAPGWLEVAVRAGDACATGEAPAGPDGVGEWPLSRTAEPTRSASAAASASPQTASPAPMARSAESRFIASSYGAREDGVVRSGSSTGSVCDATIRPMSDDFALEALGHCRLFRGLGTESLQAIGQTLRTRRFRRGEVLFHEGDPGDALFIVASGAVKVVVPSEEGGEAILATLRRGDFLGELALLDGAPRSASAIALEATQALALPRDRFNDLVASEPAIRDALLISLSGELRRLTAHVAELHFLDLTGRLAARLARLAEEQGDRAADGSVRLDASLTQTDLAAMIGATRQSVNKLLGEFVADGLLRFEHDTIVVVDVQALLRASRR